jgi:P pilus assembly chaperone PapD
MRAIRLGGLLRLTSVVRLFLFAAIVGPLVGAIPADAVAQGFGDLIVTPTRLVLEGRNTTDQVLLSNRGSETATFRISLTLMAMDEQGNLKETDTPPPDLKGATDLLRFAPRQVVIAPGGTQVVRLTLRKPQDLADGEYRAHLFMRAVPPENRGTGIAASPGTGGELTIDLIPIFGIAIPVIVRHGSVPPAKATLTDLALQRAEQGLAVHATIQRDGIASLFGDVIVRYRRDGAEPVVVGEVSRLAVYPEIRQRRIVVPVTPPDGIRIEKGRLEVVYQTATEASAPLATAEIDIK